MPRLTPQDSDIVINVRDAAFLVLTLIYAIDVGVRISGLGWSSFRKNWWHLYDCIVVVGTFATTIPVLAGTTNQVAVQCVARVETSLTCAGCRSSS